MPKQDKKQCYFIQANSQLRQNFHYPFSMYLLHFTPGITYHTLQVLGPHAKYTNKMKKLINVTYMILSPIPLLMLLINSLLTQSVSK
jgi:hypothetical protein